MHKELLVSVGHQFSSPDSTPLPLPALGSDPVGASHSFYLPVGVCRALQPGGAVSVFSSVKTLRFLRAEPLNSVSFVAPYTHAHPQKQLTDIC